MTLRVAIFDLDGVIVDTARYHYLAWKRLAHELGFVFTEEDNEALKGVSRMASLDILLEVGDMAGHFTSQQKEEMATRKNRWYVEYISRMTPEEILPGVLRFLGEVRYDGVRTALGSASKNTSLILNRLGIADLFDAVVDGTMVEAAKPDPEVFLKGAGLLGVEPDECVVFEDAVAGVEAAHRGGMLAVGVGSSEILHRADRVIPGFGELHWRTLKKELERMR